MGEILPPSHPRASSLTPRFVEYSTISGVNFPKISPTTRSRGSFCPTHLSPRCEYWLNLRYPQLKKIFLSRKWTNGAQKWCKSTVWPVRLKWIYGSRKCHLISWWKSNKCIDVKFLRKSHMDLWIDQMKWQSGVRKRSDRCVQNEVCAFKSLTIKYYQSLIFFYSLFSRDYERNNYTTHPCHPTGSWKLTHSLRALRLHTNRLHWEFA